MAGLLYTLPDRSDEHYKRIVPWQGIFTAYLITNLVSSEFIYHLQVLKVDRRSSFCFMQVGLT